MYIVSHIELLTCMLATSVRLLNSNWLPLAAVVVAVVVVTFGEHVSHVVSSMLSSRACDL